MFNLLFPDRHNITFLEVKYNQTDKKKCGLTLVTNKATATEPPFAVADPGFPVGGCQPHGGANSWGGYISKNLYVKTKELGPLGGRAPAAPPGSANVLGWKKVQNLLPGKSWHFSLIMSSFMEKVRHKRIQFNQIRPPLARCWLWPYLKS